VGILVARTTAFVVRGLSMNSVKSRRPANGAGLRYPGMLADEAHYVAGRECVYMTEAIHNER
jgi:hypothetical protein